MILLHDIIATRFIGFLLCSWFRCERLLRGAFTVDLKRMGKNKRVKSLLAGLSQDVLLSLLRPSERNEKRAIEEEEKHSSGSQVKRRKLTGLLGEGWEKYDATNSVPFYTKSSEVPERLVKCEFFMLSLSLHHFFHENSTCKKKKISSSVSVISLYTSKDAFSMRKDGTALLQRPSPMSSRKGADAMLSLMRFVE